MVTEHCHPHEILAVIGELAPGDRLTRLGLGLAALLREALSDPDILEILTDFDVLDADGPSLLGDMEFLETVEPSSPSPDEISSEEAALLFILDDGAGGE